MVRRLRPFVPASLMLVLALACKADDGHGQDDDGTGTGSEDPGTGDGDGDPSTGDGDGDPSTGDGDGDGDGDSSLTYYADTKVIIDARCVTCHADGGIGPFSLESWDQVEQWAPIMAPVIGDLSMPPWPPSSTCNTYEDDRSLTVEQRDLMLEWIDAGYPEGDPADAPPDPEPPTPFEADFTVTLPAPYTPSGALDDYRCFVIPWPEELTDTVYVTGQIANPDQIQLVHHEITFVADASEAAFYQGLDDAEPGPGYECFGGPGKLDWSARWLGAWVPGMQPWKAPAGTGVAVTPGSVLVVQIHYNTLSAEPVADQTSLGFQIVDSVDRAGTFVPVVDYGWIAGWNKMTIPAGEADVHHGVALARDHQLFQFLLAPLGVGPTEEIDIWRGALHMHLLGTHAKLAVLQDDASEDCVLQIDDWDFNWQGDYPLAEPVAFGAGDTMQLDCWYDNTAENQPLVDGQPKDPETVEWGDGTFDEMCLGVVYAAKQ